MKDIIIAGGGAAAMSAGIYAARNKKDVLVVAEEFGGQVNKTELVENYLGFKSIKGQELGQKFEEHLRDYDVETKQETIIGVEKNNGQFTVKTKQDSYQGKSVIIALGSHRRKLDIPGEEKLRNKGVSYCAVCDGPLFQQETIAIIGGGYSGCEAALYMRDIADKVYLINNSSQLQGEPITVDKVRQETKIEIINQADVSQITGEDSVTGLVYRDQHDEEQKLDVSGLFVEIGTIPNTDLICDQLVDKNEQGYIVVDDDMKTSTEGLYAAGDITNKGQKQIVVSAAQGAISALNASEYVSKSSE